jgi:signal transduction histidine kinase
VIVRWRYSPATDVIPSKRLKSATSPTCALAELRETVGVLRDPAPLTPTVGLADLPDLIASVRASGPRVSVTAEFGRPLPWAVDVAAYRVVQESLTNVCKHAGPVQVVVTVRSTMDGLTVQVTNDEPVTGDEPAAGGRMAGGGGHGIAGMRERVEALGGRLHAGPRPAGGFRVSAVLPA